MGFSKKTQWISTDAWRGYNQPVFWVAGANDTGMWSDSPCRTDVALKELGMVKSLLRKNGIPCRSMITESSNVFCAHRYIIVQEEDLQRAREIITEWWNANDKEMRWNSDLLYVNELK